MFKNTAFNSRYFFNIRTEGNNFDSIGEKLRYDIFKSFWELPFACYILQLSSNNYIESIAWDLRQIYNMYILAIVFDYTDYTSTEIPIRKAVMVYNNINENDLESNTACSTFNLFDSFLWSYTMIDGRIMSEVVTVKYNINFITVISKEYKTYTISTYLMTGGINSV